MVMRIVTVVAMVINLVAFAAAIPGTATYRKRPFVPSTCFSNEDQGILVAGVSDEIWNNRAACGRTYRVRCTGPDFRFVPHPCKDTVIMVKIVEHYSPYGTTMVLPEAAFTMIAEPIAGKVDIEYEEA